MDWPANLPPLWIAALAASLVLAVINWRSMTGGQLIESPDGIGGRRFYSRWQLAVVPPLFILIAGLVSHGVVGGLEASRTLRLYGGLWIAGALAVQLFLIAVARKVRRDRRGRRDAMSGK